MSHQTRAIANAGREHEAPYGRSPLACPETVLSVFTFALTCLGPVAAFILALGKARWIVVRARLLDRAGATALEKGIEDPQGKAGLEIVKALTGDDEPWYRRILGPRSDDGQP